MTSLFRIGTAGIFCLVVSVINAQPEALKIIGNGNVGIGVDNPTEKLQVNGRIMDKTGLVMPVGTILPFAGAKPPVGWLLCDGRGYSKTGDQKDLFEVIGVMYGASGKDSFNLPDLRASFIMGAVAQNPVDSLAKTGGPDQHNHLIKLPPMDFTTTTDGNHNHKMPSEFYDRRTATSVNNEESRAGKYIGWFNGIDRGSNSVKSAVTQDAGNHSHKVRVDLPQAATASSTGNNRPKWMALNYIIKY